MNKNAIKYVKKRLVKNRVCNRCGSYVLKSESKDYSYQCMKCDEDLYTFETRKTNVKIKDMQLKRLIVYTNYFLNY